MATSTIKLGRHYFTNATPSEAATLETLCPFVSATELSLYYVTGANISDGPIDAGTATAYIACFGGSSKNHLHILLYSSNTNVGRMFIRGTAGGVAGEWKEVQTSSIE